MSLFVHVENQKLLWETISKTDLFSRSFAGSQEESSHWFKIIIQQFYNKNKGKTLTRSDLGNLNREVLSYMVSALKQKLSVPPILSTTTQPLSPQHLPSQYDTLPLHNINLSEKQSLQNAKQDLYNSQFANLQREYNSLLEKPMPPNVDIGDGIKDEAISNMDELIQQHMRQRDAELNIFTQNANPGHQQLQQLQPLPIIQSQHSIITSTKINIDVNKNIELKTEEIVEIPKKTVSWSDDNELGILRIQVNELKDKFTIFEEQLKKIMEKLSDAL